MSGRPQTDDHAMTLDMREPPAGVTASFARDRRACGPARSAGRAGARCQDGDSVGEGSSASSMEGVVRTGLRLRFARAVRRCQRSSRSSLRRSFSRRSTTCWWKLPTVPGRAGPGDHLRRHRRPLGSSRERRRPAGTATIGESAAAFLGSLGAGTDGARSPVPDRRRGVADLVQRPPVRVPSRSHAGQPELGAARPWPSAWSVRRFPPSLRAGQDVVRLNGLLCRAHLQPYRVR